MAVKYLCDECGSGDDVKHLRISFEVDPPEPPPRRLGDALYGLGETRVYEHDLCNSCLDRKIRQFDDLVKVAEQSSGSRSD
jgi:hypothetical protein